MRFVICYPHLGPLPVDCAQLENLKRTHSPTPNSGSLNVVRQARLYGTVASLPANNLPPVRQVWQGKVHEKVLKESTSRG